MVKKNIIKNSEQIAPKIIPPYTSCFRCPTLFIASLSIDSNVASICSITFLSIPNSCI